MWLFKLLRRTELSQWLRFVSPSFFDVVPSKSLYETGNRLLSNYRNDARFRVARAKRAQHLQALGLPVQIAESGRGERSPGDPVDYGRRVVELYFHQIFVGQTVLADLSSEALWSDGQKLIWCPNSLHFEWSPDFRQSLCQIYAGFYNDDDRMFRSGLDALGLLPAEDLFREQFGASQEHVQFDVKEFVSSFHRIFERCKQKGIRLHPDFVLLGMYLASLYQNLDRSKVGVDVRQAFRNATRHVKSMPEYDPRVEPRSIQGADPLANHHSTQAAGIHS